MRKKRRRKHFIPIVFALFILIIGGIFDPVFASIKPFESNLPIAKCFEINDPNIESVASDNNSLFIIKSKGEIAKLDSQTGETIWRAEVGSKTRSFLNIYQERIFAFSSRTDSTDKNNLEIRELDNMTGITKKTRVLEIDGKYTPIYTSDHGDVFLETTSQVIMYNPLDEEFTKIEKITKEKKVFLDQEKDFLYLHNNTTLSLIKKNDGSAIKNQNTKTENVSAILFFEKSVFLGDESGRVFQTGENLGTLKKVFRGGGKITSIQGVNNSILFTSDDNFIYLYSPKNKDVVWKKRLPGRVLVQPVKYLNSLAITTTADPEIYFFETLDGKVSNRIVLNEKYYIRDIKVSDSGIFVLTNYGISKYNNKCGQ